MNSYKYVAKIHEEVFGKDFNKQDIHINGTLEAIETLSEKEQICLYKRHAENKTLKEIGKDLGVTQERIRQVLSKAYRKLKNPQKVRLMLVSKIIEENNRLKQEILELKSIIKTREITEKPQNTNIVLSIEDMNLSGRCHNIMKRQGMKTVYDILKITSYSRLEATRNMGKQAISELFSKMRELGFDEWVDKMEEQRQ